MRSVNQREYEPEIKTPFPYHETILEVEILAGGPEPPPCYIAPSHLGKRPGGGIIAMVHLRDEWTWMHVAPQDIVHLVGRWEFCKESSAAAKIHTCNVDDSADEFDEFDNDLLNAALDQVEGQGVPAHADEVCQSVMIMSTFAPPGRPWSKNLFILHPDIIISSSRLSSTISCMRRSMLQERLKSFTDTTYAAAFGHMVHSVLQACLLANTPEEWDYLGNFTPEFVRNAIEDVLVRLRGTLIINGVSTSQAREELLEVAPMLIEFGRNYLVFANGDPHFHNCAVEDQKGDSQVQILRVLDTEEDIVAPMYGLKGRVDVCAQVEYRGNRPGVTVVPLEVKTGRVTRSMEHAAQTALYTLLLSDRFGVEVDSGLLLYTQTGDVRRVYPTERDIRSLILARNEMATYKLRKPNAKPLNGANVQDIEQCNFLPPTIDNNFKCSRCYVRDACMLYRCTYDPMGDSPISALYDERTAHLTDHDTSFFRHWDALLSLEEKTLACFQHELWSMSSDERAHMGRCLPGLVLSEIVGPGRISLYSPKYTRSTFSVDDSVLLSVDSPEPRSLAHGRILNIDGSVIELTVERDIERAIQIFRELLGVSTCTFRLDADELMQTMAVARYNFTCILYPDAPPRIERLKQCIVALSPPTFRELTTKEQSVLESFTSSCNDGQKRAIECGITACDYALVHGMPGTGKTTAVATLIRVLVALGQRVLLCSYTHSAVDTILAMLVGTDVDVLRLGNLTRIHKRVRHMALEVRIPPDADAETYLSAVSEAQVIASTSLGINDAVFMRQSFDVCIIDEASQVTLPTCIGPLRFADRFVMIGDHQQLAPVVRDREAAAGGLAESLFERLCVAHPSAVTRLVEQYRMNDEIMALSNALVYNGALQAPKSVAQRRLQGKQSSATGWIATAGDPARPVIFVDTSKMPAYEERCDTQLENSTEGKLITLLLEELLLRGIPASSIGILTPYRQQARHLSMLGLGSEVLTVDQAQGRDWPVVICSFVRSNNAHADGELLRDSRRINVLLTRAQSKLVLIGARVTIDQPNSPMRVLFSLLGPDQIVEAEHNAPRPSKVLRLA